SLDFGQIRNDAPSRAKEVSKRNAAAGYTCHDSYSVPPRPSAALQTKCPLRMEVSWASSTDAVARLPGVLPASEGTIAAPRAFPSVLRPPPFRFPPIA